MCGALDVAPGSTGEMVGERKREIGRGREVERKRERGGRKRERERGSREREQREGERCKIER